MIKKLRRNVILILVIILSIGLAIVLSIFGATKISEINTIKNNLLKITLEASINNQPLPVDNVYNIRNLSAIYTIPDQKLVITSNQWNLETTEISKILNTTINQEQTDNNFSYIKKIVNNQIHIAIIDNEITKEILNNTFKQLLFIWIFFNIIFIIISYILSNILTKPVSKSIEQQKQFIADASHELKNPLAVIAANTQILLSHPTDSISSQNKWINNTKIEVDRMKELVNQLLFLAHSDASNNQIKTEKINFSDIVDHQCLMYESLAFERKKSLLTNIEPNLYISGNSDLLKKLVSILCDNALKYAYPNTEILIDVYSKEGYIYLKTQNQSDNLSSEDLKNIFKRFYRVEKSRNREYGGYGLGLAMAHEITKQHKGKINVTSQDHLITFLLSFNEFKQ